jgi:CHASE1-domain containing sensor protein
MSRLRYVIVILALLVLSAGLGTSWQLHSSIQKAESLQTQDRLRTAGRSVRDAFESDLARAVQGVEGAAIYVTFQDNVTWLQWLNYGNNLLQHLVQVSALEWTPVVRAEKREEFLRDVQQSGMTDYALREPNARGELQVAGERSLHLPVLYVVPPN